jgi:hypothetical protein
MHTDDKIRSKIKYIEINGTYSPLKNINKLIKTKINN